MLSLSQSGRWPHDVGMGGEAAHRNGQADLRRRFKTTRKGSLVCLAILYLIILANIDFMLSMCFCNV